MIFLKATTLSLLTVSFITHGHVGNIDRLCEDIKHSEDVSVCLIESVEEIKKEYNESFVEYQFSIGSEGVKPYNKKEMVQLVKKAKLNWQKYLTDECLIESSKFERGSTGFNDSYNICLIKNYKKRIEYYKSNRL